MSRLSPRRILMGIGCLLFAFSLISAYWPRSTDILIPVVNRAGKYGYVNQHGQIVHPFHWDDARRFGKHHLAGVTKDKKWGAINRQGEFVIPMTWEQGGGFVDSGLALTIQGGKRGLINLRGEVVIPHEWDFIEPILTKTGIDFVDAHGWAKVRQGSDEDIHNTRDGWVDLQGKVVIPVKYKFAESFDEHGWAAVKDDKKRGWIDRLGQWVMPPTWDGCSSFDKHGWAAVKKGNQWGYIDRSGNVVIPITWDSCWMFHDSGYAQVLKNNRHGIINREGRPVIPTEWDMCTIEDCGFIRVKRDGKEGCINLEGQVIIPLEFCDLYPIRGSDYWEAKKQESSLIGLLDKTGRTVLDFKWDHIDLITDGTSRESFYRCMGPAEKLLPGWLENWVIVIYAKLGQAWDKPVQCNVYDANLNLVWRNNAWMNNWERYAGAAGVLCMLIGLWRMRRSRPRKFKASVPPPHNST